MELLSSRNEMFKYLVSKDIPDTPPPKETHDETK